MTCTEAELRFRAQAELHRRVAQAELARRSLADFFRQAVAAGVVGGVRRLEWGPHLDFYCTSVQLQLESWLVAYGMGTEEMIARQREAWERTGAVWEDGKPDPWLRYPLAQNQCDNLPPTTLKSTISMVIANAWIWLWVPAFSFTAASGVEANVDRDSKATRELVRSPWYRQTFSIAWQDVDLEVPIEIRRDMDSVRIWGTTAGGKRDSRTMNSGWIGAHGDCVVGETRIATEVGEIAIEDLVQMSLLPRVWSLNHDTGEAELVYVRAWRAIGARPTVDVFVGPDRMLRCTSDHRIFTVDRYTHASECAGRAVSVMSWPEPSRPQRTGAMLSVLEDQPDMRNVLEGVRAGRGGVREADQEGREVRSVLFDCLPSHQSRRPGAHQDVPVREGFQAERQQGKSPPLLRRVLRRASDATSESQTVRDVWECDGKHTVLLARLQGQGALSRDARLGELELPGQRPPVQRWPTGEPPAADPRSGRPRVRGLLEDEAASGPRRASHRRGSGEQHTGEPDHALRLVPQLSSQVSQPTVEAATVSAVRDSSGTHTVYDLEVGGSHNFFANGVLVHNCLFCDDPDDPDKVWGEAERLKPQNRWTRAIENRTNDDNRSSRRVLQQRTHVEDFTAYLLALSRWTPTTPKGWALNCLPAEYGMGPEDAPAETPYGQRDWRSDKGDTLHRLLSPGVLADHKLKRPEYEGLYNQNPGRRGDGMFKARHARFFIWEHQVGQWLAPRPEGCIPRDDMPALVIRPSQLRDLTLSVDAANSLDPTPGAKVSAVGLTVGACLGEQRFMLEDATRVLGVSGTYKAVYQLAARWQLDRILVELKALGAGVISELQLAIRRGWYIDPDTDRQVELVGPDGNRLRCEVETFAPGKEDKVQRAHGMLPAWEQGLIHFHDGADWMFPRKDAGRKTLDEGCLGEVTTFPHSRRADRVDSWSQFCARYRNVEDPATKWRAMARLRAVR